MQKLQEELAESKRDSHECKEETKKLRSQFEKQNDELQSLRLLLHHAHDKEEAQDSLLKHHEMQRKQYEVERGNFLCAEAKLKDLKSVEIVLSGMHVVWGSGLFHFIYFFVSVDPQLGFLAAVTNDVFVTYFEAFCF